MVNEEPDMKLKGKVNQTVKDVPTSIPKNDLLCVTMAVIHVA